MNVGRHESSGLRESLVIRSHSPYCEAKGPIVEKGFVASRIRAIHGARNQTWVSSWSHSPMISCPIHSNFQNHESCPSAQLRPTPKTRQCPPILSANVSIAGFAKPLPEGNSASEWRNNQSQVSSSNNVQNWLQDDVLHSGLISPTRQTTAEDGRSAQVYNIEGSPNKCSASWKDDEESGRLVELPKSSISEHLDSTSDNAFELRFDPSRECNATETSSLSLDDTNADRKPSQSPSLHLQSSVSKDLSLRSLAKKSLTSLLFSTDDGWTSAEHSPRPKKYQIRRKAKKQATSQAPTETFQITDPLETGLPLSHTLASPKNIRRAFSLQPSSKPQKNTPEHIELRPMSADPTLNRSYYQCATASSDQISAGHTFDPGVPQEPTAWIKSPRHSISNGLIFPRRFSSGASMKLPSVLSGTPSAQIRKRWSGWKLRPAQPEVEETLDRGPELLQRSASQERHQTDDTSPTTQDSITEDLYTQPGQDERLTPVRKRWSGWKLQSADKQPELEETLNRGPKLIQQPASQQRDQINDTSPTARDSTADYPHRQPALDERIVSEWQLKGDVIESDPTRQAENSANTDQNRTPRPTQPLLSPSPRASTISAHTRPEPHHPSLRQPRPQHPQLHHQVSDLVANLPRESSPPHGSPSAVSPAPLHTDTPSQSLKWGNRPQRITRIQVIVSLDGPADALSESSLERKGKRFF